MNHTSQKPDHTPQKPHHDPAQGPPRGPSFIPQGINWRPMIWFTLAWLLFIVLFAPTSNRERIDLSYSQFKEEVQQGNVAEVTVKGEHINGVFANDYQVKDEENGRTYRYFSTHVPSFGDGELMTILETNQVVIKAEEDERSWLTQLLISLVPWVLIIGLIMYAHSRPNAKTPISTQTKVLLHFRTACSAA